MARGQRGGGREGMRCKGFAGGSWGEEGSGESVGQPFEKIFFISTTMKQSYMIHVTNP